MLHEPQPDTLAAVGRGLQPDPGVLHLQGDEAVVKGLVFDQKDEE